MILVKEAFGPDAVILSNKDLADGVELIVTDDFYEQPNGNFTKEKNISTSNVDNLVIDLKSPNELALKDLRLEVESLRNLVQEQLSELIWENKKRLYPIQALVVRRLISLGFSAEVATRIASGLETNLSTNDIWKTVKGKIIQSLPGDIKSGAMREGIFAIFGTSGVGKTTVIAKLAAQQALKFGAHNIGIISTDTTKIGASETLKIYANILNIPIRIVENHQSMQDALNDFKKRQLILIDTPGIAPFHTNGLQTIMQMFPDTCNIEKLLIVPANMQCSSLEKIMEFYQSFGIGGCILTKIDESSHFGGALSVVINLQLPIWYVSIGQKIPDDIQIFSATKFVTQILNLDAKDEINDALIARSFAESKVN
jgi:flagellar biosynthesis protein FlhF